MVKNNLKSFILNNINQVEITVVIAVVIAMILSLFWTNDTKLMSTTHRLIRTHNNFYLS